MAEETKLPEQWQELPQVKSLVEEAVRQARGSMAGMAKERDALKKELQQLKQELADIREKAEPAEKPAVNKSAPAPNDDNTEQERKRLEGLVKKQQERIKALETELQNKNRRLAEEVLERGIREAVGKVGEVHKDAWKDVVARGKALFSLDEQGQPVARDAAGDVIYGKDGLQPLSFEEWARSLMAEAPHLFKATGQSGSGAAGGNGGQQAGKTVTLSKQEARNPLAYRKAKERAAKLGAELIIQ